MKCSLFGHRLSNTMMKSTRLQMQPSAASSSILPSPGGGPRRQSRWCLVRPFHRSSTRYPSHPSHPNGSGGFHIGAVTRNTSVPAGLSISAFAFGLFSPRSCAFSCPRHASWSIAAPPPATPHPTTTLGSWTWKNPRLSYSTRFLHPSDGIKRRVILLELV